MSEVQSGKELCDEFFEALKNRKDIDQKVGMLIRSLYSEGKLTGSDILEGLKALRVEKEGERENQT